MKIIIDMPKEKYEWIKTHNLNIDNNSIVGAVANGIPYEERPQGDLISREALKEVLHNEIGDHALSIAIDRVIDNAPTVRNEYMRGYEAAEREYKRPQGEWIDEGQYAEGHSEHAYICKECGYQIIEIPNMIFENRFCKYCGAKMKGGVE